MALAEAQLYNLPIGNDDVYDDGNIRVNSCRTVLGEKRTHALYNIKTGEYEFLSQGLYDIPAFKILGLIKPTI